MISLLSAQGWEALQYIVLMLAFAAVMIVINWPSRCNHKDAKDDED